MLQKISGKTNRNPPPNNSKHRDTEVQRFNKNKENPNDNLNDNTNVNYHLVAALEIKFKIIFKWTQRHKGTKGIGEVYP